jgi:hypothetical protein
MSLDRGDVSTNECAAEQGVGCCALFHVAAFAAVKRIDEPLHAAEVVGFQGFVAVL